MKRRKLLMIPGPIEFEPDVLQAMATPTPSHVAPNFIEIFGNSLELMREVWMAPTGQPFIVAGSGTLAMDMAAANLIEEGDAALVVSTGYFGERFNDILERYGADTTVLNSSIGDIVSLEQIEQELQKKQFKVLVFTHVDTSTGVKVDPEPISKLAKKYDVLSILDGVCSVAGEEIKQDEWGIDIVLTGSQKAIGVPPGLALLVASQKAMNVWRTRTTPVGSYYTDWKNWLPIMTAYEERNPSYFGTPPVNLILALETSLKLICDEGIASRIKRHTNLASAFRTALTSLNLKLLPNGNAISANTLSAVYFPDTIDGSAMRSKMMESDVIIAGGLLPEIKTSYFRIGHMGAVSANDLLSVLGALERALQQLDYNFETGISLKTFQDQYLLNN